MRLSRLHPNTPAVRPGPGRYSALGLALLLAGCAVGPDFQQPAAPTVAADRPYTPTALPAQTASAPGLGGESQHFQLGQDIQAQWWTMFHSPALDELIQSALTQSPTLASSQAALRQAQELYAAEYGSTMLPSVGVGLNGERERAAATQTGVPGGQLTNLYNASVNVSYTLDLFGGNRRALEGSQAAIDEQRFEVEAAYLSLTANLVTTAIQEASLRAQLKATHEVLKLQEDALGVVDRQQKLGAVPLTAVLAERTQIAQTRATLPPLEKALALLRHQLSAYAGRLPGDEGLPEFTLESLSLPQDLPVSLPSALVQQRPDIRAAEAQLHEASAQVGVATANLYPQITLSGSYGSSSFTTGKLFGAGFSFWSLGAGLTQPVFNGGALTAKRRAAVAAFDEAAAQYRQTVLNAFLNVANSLRALDSDAQALEVQDEAARVARASLDLSTQQYQVGALSYLSLLDAQRSYQQTQVSLAQAQAARFADTAALFQSLGGGWWNRQALAEIKIAPTGAAQR